MDPNLISLISVLFTIVAYFLGALVLFFWNRSEAREDMRMVCGILKAISDEIKDFHGRLCALEEKYRGGK
jgi:hypothetical protein